MKKPSPRVKSNILFSGMTLFAFTIPFFLIVFLFSKSVLGQTPSPNGSNLLDPSTTPAQISQPVPIGTPTNVVGSIKPKKKKVVFDPNGEREPGSMKEAHEAQSKKYEELKKEGKLKSFGIPGTVRRIPKPLTPTNFKIKPGDGSAYLSWDEVPSNWDKSPDGKPLGGMGYLIYISEDGRNFKKRLDGDIKETQIKIGNLTNGKNYYFAIVALGEGGAKSDKVINKVIPVASDISQR